MVCPIFLWLSVVPSALEPRIGHEGTHSQSSLLREQYSTDFCQWFRNLLYYAFPDEFFVADLVYRVYRARAGPCALTQPRRIVLPVVHFHYFPSGDFFGKSSQ